jgi:hypothetical protein
MTREPSVEGGQTRKLRLPTQKPCWVTPNDAEGPESDAESLTSATK